MVFFYIISLLLFLSTALVADVVSIQMSWKSREVRTLDVPYRLFFLFFSVCIPNTVLEYLLMYLKPCHKGVWEFLTIHRKLWLLITYLVKSSWVIFLFFFLSASLWVRCFPPCEQLSVFANQFQPSLPVNSGLLKTCFWQSINLSTIQSFHYSWAREMAWKGSQHRGRQS